VFDFVLVPDLSKGRMKLRISTSTHHVRPAATVLSVGSRFLYSCWNE